MRRLAAITLALVAAGFAFAVYRSQHHGLRVNSGGDAPIGVLVAKKEIPKGTTVNAIRQLVLYRVAAIPSQALTGAIVDPAALANKVALRDIPPGAQLTVADFGSAVTLTSYPGGWQRAVTLTSPKEIGGRVEVGSRVDVLLAGSGKDSRVRPRHVSSLSGRSCSTRSSRPLRVALGTFVVALEQADVRDT